MKRHARGFTLIELLITVVIVAVLAAIAYPSYQRYLQKTRRAQVKSDLTEIAGGLEREFTVNRSYTGYTLPFTNSPRDTGAVVAYTIAAVITPKAFTLTATRANSQTSDICGNLSLDNTGTKHHTVGADADCNWGVP